MQTPVRNFVTIDSAYGPFIINRHCSLQAEALIKTGRPHIQPELDAMLQVIDQLPDHCVAVDGGANAGLVCIPLARRLLARRGQVHAFEPQRIMYYALCGTVALNQLDNLVIHHLGLASGNATMTVPPLDYAQDMDFGSVELAQSPIAGGSEVQVVRLDALGLDRLDFLKLDIEGMEADALRGAKRLLRDHHPWCWIEYWKIGEQAIMAEFEGLDYAFYKMDQRNLLCVPRRRWDPERLHIQGEPLTFHGGPAASAHDALDVTSLRQRAMTHQANCEWGHALDLWRQLRARGLDDVDMSIQMAACASFAELPEAGLLALRDTSATAPATAAEQELWSLHESMLLLGAGRHQEAAEARQACEQWFTLDQFGAMGLLREKHYAGQALAGKRLLVMGYGGAGDQLQYARYFHAAKLNGCREITAVVGGALCGLLRHNFPDVRFVEGQGQHHDTTGLEHDYWCSFLTLATSFGLDPRPTGMAANPAHPAYIECPPPALDTWGAWVGAGRPREVLNLGLNWQGMPSSDAQFLRAAGLRDMAHLARMGDTQAVCLNRDLTAPMDRDAASIRFPGHRIADFSDLAGLTASMDVCVTTCTAQVHLAGALGVPTILLLSPKADPRWGRGRQTDLYASVQIVRAARAREWDDAIDEAMSLIYALRLERRAAAG